MRAGQLRHRLQIQEPTETALQSGEKAQTWATIATVWGRIEPLSGKELWEAQQTRATISHKITVRYGASPDLLATYRVVFGVRTFGLTAVLNRDERNIELTLYAEELAA